MRRLALLVLAALLAGCTGDTPGALQPGEPTYSDAEVPMGPGLAPMTWQTLLETDFVLTAATPISAGVSIPDGTRQVLVNFTLEGGATATGLFLTLGECTWRRDVPLVMGQAFGADCGGLLPGQDTLSVGLDAGALAGVVTVEAVVCDARQGACPAPAPVPTS